MWNYPRGKKGPMGKCSKKIVLINYEIFKHSANSVYFCKILQKKNFLSSAGCQQTGRADPEGCINSQIL